MAVMTGGATTLPPPELPGPPPPPPPPPQPSNASSTVIASAITLMIRLPVSNSRSPAEAGNRSRIRLVTGQRLTNPALIFLVRLQEAQGTITNPACGENVSRLEMGCLQRRLLIQECADALNR